MKNDVRFVDVESVFEAIVEKGQTSKRYEAGEIWELNFAEIREALDNVPQLGLDDMIKILDSVDRHMLDAVSSLFKGGWTLCSTRLPIRQEEVIVSCHDDSGDTPFDYTACGYWVGLLPDDDPAWIVDGEVNYHVVAWQPLPKPYKI